MEERFDQDGFKFFFSIEELLCSAAAGTPYDESLEKVKQCFSGRSNYFESIKLVCIAENFDAVRLQTQLQMLTDIFREKKPVVLTDFVKELNDLGKAKYLFSEIVALVKLFLVLPVTTATL
jgi:hypothetical protein